MTSSGKVYIDMSTISASTSREIAEQVAAKGAGMLDAPVSSNLIHVEEGIISMIVGGDQAIFEKVKPILQDIIGQ